jgi:hypothetical protein
MSFGVTVEVWRATLVDTPHGKRPVFSLHHTEDGWAFAPPTPIDQAEPVESGRDPVLDALNGYRPDLPTEILAEDELAIPGQGEPGRRFKVKGRPGPWTDPWDDVFAGSTCRVLKVTG